MQILFVLSFRKNIITAGKWKLKKGLLNFSERLFGKCWIGSEYIAELHRYNIGSLTEAKLQEHADKEVSESPWKWQLTGCSEQPGNIREDSDFKRHVS